MAFGRRHQSRSLSFSKQGTATNFGNYKKQKLTSQNLTQNTSNPNNSYSSLFSGKVWCGGWDLNPPLFGDITRSSSLFFYYQNEFDEPDMEEFIQFGLHTKLAESSP
jgi:hypothetical protein